MVLKNNFNWLNVRPWKRMRAKAQLKNKQRTLQDRSISVCLGSGYISCTLRSCLSGSGSVIGTHVLIVPMARPRCFSDPSPLFHSVTKDRMLLDTVSQPEGQSYSSKRYSFVNHRFLTILPLGSILAIIHLKYKIKMNAVSYLFIRSFIHHSTTAHCVPTL